MHALIEENTSQCLKRILIYRMAGNFGEVFNLAIWRIQYRLPN
jgi:hypothetical protein